MIKYSLKCKNLHQSESWFASSEAFEKLKISKLLSCEVCGCSEIEKDLMSPRLQSESKGKKFKKNMLVKPQSEAEKILKDFKEKIEKNSENVGKNFAKIAREIHEGDSPERSIIGEATPKETLELIEDEIPVTPLPWFNRKSH